MTQLCIDPLARPFRRVEAASSSATDDPERFQDALTAYLRAVAAQAGPCDPALLGAMRGEVLARLRSIVAGGRTVSAVAARGDAGTRGTDVVGHIVRGVAKGTSASSTVFDRLLVSSTPASALRARELFFAREMAFRYRVRDLSRPFRVLVMGAAAIPGVVDAAGRMNARGGAVELVLVDADEAALRSAVGGQGPPPRVRIDSRAVDPVGLAFAEEEAEPLHDLVLISGHLDFAPDQIASRLLDFGFSSLSPGGELLAGHFHRDLTPLDRILMEWWLEWYPYYRSPKEVGALVSRAKVREQGGRAAGMVRGPNVYVVIQRP